MEGAKEKKEDKERRRRKDLEPVARGLGVMPARLSQPIARGVLCLKWRELQKHDMIYHQNQYLTNKYPMRCSEIYMEGLETKRPSSTNTSSSAMMDTQRSHNNKTITNDKNIMS